MIRRLDPDDAVQYRSLMLGAYLSHPEAFTSDAAERAAQPIDWWESRLSRTSEPLSIVLGAFSESTLVGVTGLLTNTRKKTSHKATIFGVYVHPSARHQAIASQLLSGILDEARQIGSIEIVQLTVSEGNTAALRLYTNNGGFTRFGVEPFALKIKDSHVAKIHLWCKL